MQITIVDQEDNIIEYKERAEVLHTDIYQVAALWLTNSNGDILLAKRSPNKKRHPNKWGPAVAGTVEKGETYDSNIIKEAEEEIGLINREFKKAKKVLVTNQYIHFTQWYAVMLDRKIGEFTKQDKEVAELKWFSRDELIQELKLNPDKFLPNLAYYFELFK
jgi:isopentenyl-diphosphate delta-isomerase